MGSQWQRARAGSLILICLLAVVGCDSNTETKQTEPAIGNVVVVSDPRELVLPLDSYFAVSNRWNAPDRAINMLGRTCMQRFGLDWPVVESTPPDKDFIDNSRRYGVFEASVAQSNGYHAPERNGTWKAVQERDPTQQERAVWAGRGVTKLNNQSVPEGGCAKEAMAQLEKGAPKPPELDAQQLAMQSTRLAENDSRVKQAVTKWVECMGRGGYSYDGPFAAADDPRWWSAAGVSQTEVETAKADVACKREVNLVGIWYAVETAYQKDLIEANAEQLTTLKTYYDTVIRNAAALVSQR